MTRDFFDSPWEQTQIVMVDEATLFNSPATRLVVRRMQSSGGRISVRHRLDEITGCDLSVTDYVFVRLAKCPRCFRQIMEKSLVERE